MMPDDASGRRTPLIIGNWKLWGTRSQARAYCERLLELLPDAGRRPADVGIAPTFTAAYSCTDGGWSSGV